MQAHKLHIMKNLISFLWAGLILMPVYGQQEQPFVKDLKWIGACPEMDRPISLGIPFSKGELKPDKAVQLKTDAGQTIASDCWPLAFWPDGSVKWAGLATVVPGGTERLFFEPTGKKGLQKHRLENAVHVTELPTYFAVSTGKLQAYVPKQGNRVLDSICVDGRKVAGAAELLCTTQDKPYAEGTGAISFADYKSKLTQVKVERAGNVRSLVRLEGVYRHSTGREWLPFVVRLYFYAGSDQIRMVHTFVFDGDMDKDFIRSLGVRFEVPMREALYNRHVAFATAEGGVWAEPVQPLSGRRILTLDGDKSWQERQMRGERIPPYEKFDAKNRNLLNHWAAWNSFRLNQTTADAFSIRKRTHADRPWVGTFSGTRAPGYVFAGDVSGGLGVSLKDFWQTYPVALQIDDACASDAHLTVWMWSPDAEPMDLRHYDGVAHDLEASYEDVQEGMSTPYGVARTHVLTLVSKQHIGERSMLPSWPQCWPKMLRCNVRRNTCMPSMLSEFGACRIEAMHKEPRWRNAWRLISLFI